MMIINPWADLSDSNKNKNSAWVDRYVERPLPSWFLLLVPKLSKGIHETCQALFVFLLDFIKDPLY
jgi:hypothetical protein